MYRKKSDTLKKFYDANPNVKTDKGVSIKQWQLQNKEQVKETNRINSLKGAAKVSKKIVVETADGDMLYFNSKSEFNCITGEWANTIIRKTQDGSFYKGYKIKDND